MVHQREPVFLLRGGVCGSRTATHGAAYEIAGRRNTLKGGGCHLLGTNPPATLLVVRLKAGRTIGGVPSAADMAAPNACKRTKRCTDAANGTTRQ